MASDWSKLISRKTIYMEKLTGRTTASLWPSNDRHHAKISVPSSIGMLNGYCERAYRFISLSKVDLNFRAFPFHTVSRGCIPWWISSWAIVNKKMTTCLKVETCRMPAISLSEAAAGSLLNRSEFRKADETLVSLFEESSTDYSRTRIQIGSSKIEISTCR